MRISTKLVVLATLTAGLAMFAPSIGALDIGCQRTTDVTTLPAGTSSLFTPPGADVLGWTPECVIIDAGQTVTFTQRDAITHGAKRTGCFDLGDMRIGGTQSLKVLGFGEEGVLMIEENGIFDICENVGIVGEGSLVIDYWCRFHGPAMPGKIVVEL